MHLPGRSAFRRTGSALIVNEKRAPEYWLNIQNQYDLACIDRDAVRREAAPG